MKVLYVASEAVPFAKTGGLADVAGSLPKALKAEGVDVRVIMPKFGKIPEKFRNAMEHVYDGEIPVSWRSKYVGLDKIEHDGVTYYFVDNEEYFRREGFYGYGDDAERFSFFCRAVLNLLPAMDFWPDVIHTNDWHSGLVNVLLKIEHQGDERYEKIRTLYTIHNLKYQGVFPKDVMSDVLGLDWKYFNNGDLEFYDAVNFMKGGLIYADYISTVSKTYAKEIQYEYFGEHLDGLLRSRQDTLFGIVNGIDYDVYNPSTDKNLYEGYDVTTLDRKADNKVLLQKDLGLPISRRTPMVAMVTRLVAAKGLDLVVRMMDEILQHEDIQFVLLGTGDKEYGLALPEEGVGQHLLLEPARTAHLRGFGYLPDAVELRAVWHRPAHRAALRLRAGRARDGRPQGHDHPVRQVHEEGQRLPLCRLQCA